MENTKPYQIEDLRQSESWSKYLKYLGWNIENTENGIIYTHGYGPFKLAKFQRPKNLNKMELKKIDETCKKIGALFIKLEPNIIQSETILLESGYKKSMFPYLPPTTSIINLKKDKNTLWSNLSHSAKYSINRAKREGASVEFYRNPGNNIIDMFCNLSEQSSKKRNFIDVRKVDMLKKVEIFKDNSFVLCVKDPSGECMVADFFLVHKNTVWFMHGGTADIGRKGKWGYELIWQAINYFKDNGYEYLDLEGLDDKRFPHMTKSWGGFSHFKEKFGGKKAVFPTPYLKIYNPFLKFLEKIYGKMPF